MIHIAFAGFRHDHILNFYKKALTSQRMHIVGAFEEDDKTREMLEKKYNILFNYSSYDKLLADEKVQAVAIGDYYGIRGERVIQALKAGKHVISDKPLCTTLEEEKEIRRLSENCDLKAYLLLDLRFENVYSHVKRLIQEDVIGEITNIFFEGQHPLRYHSRPDWFFEKGKHGGTINDIAVHGIDLVKYMTGLEVADIDAAREWNSFDEKAIDFKNSAIFMCRLTNEAGLMADVSYSAPDTMGYSMPTYWYFQIWGKRGMICFGRNLETIELYKNGRMEVERVSPMLFHKQLIDDFADYIEGKGNIILNHKDVFYATRTALQIQAEANRGEK